MHHYSRAMKGFQTLTAVSTTVFVLNKLVIPTNETIGSAANETNFLAKITGSNRQFFVLRSVSCDTLKHAECSDIYQKYQKNLDTIGFEDDNTLTSWKNLGVCYSQNELNEEADEIFVALLVEAKKRFGSEDYRVLITAGMVASNFLLQGKYDQAEPIYIESYHLSKKLFGEQNNQTYQYMALLLECYLKQRKYNEAEPLIEKKISMMTKMLGPKHELTIATQNDLKLCQKNMRK